MTTIRRSISVIVILTLGVLSTVAQAQYSRGYGQDRARAQLLTRIDQRASRLQITVQRTLNQSQMDNTQREDNINQLVTDFKQATTDLRGRFNRREASATDVQALLDRAARINRVMLRRQVLAPVQGDWRLLRADLDSLASSYKVSWDWNAENGPDRADSRDSRDGERIGGLTGTYRLNTARSDNARLIVDRAVRSLPYNDRQRVSESLLRRVDAPETLAIERHGRSITLASSRAPQMSFDADGQERVEQLPNSQRTSRVTVSLVGDGLTINALGDRATDFTVTFDPIDNGRQLRVTRRLSTERLDQPVIVQSTYDRSSEAARWDVYTEQSAPPVGPVRGDRDGPDRIHDQGRSGLRDFFVPEGTVLVTRLESSLDTSRVHSGDRFALTVVSPRQYEGARIEGTIGDVNRSGRISGRAGLNLAFDTIRLRDGQAYRFEGTIDSVRAQNGDNVRVDREGNVADDTSQTSRTVTRSAVGTAVGALIGAIAGGGKGAAIGAVAGAGVGAGSVYVQGRDDLELTSGTEMTIRSSSPRNVTAR